ncbi:hypothetical protein D3C85_1545090 [compost metagenome]
MKSPYPAPEDAVGPIASVLEAAMFLHGDPEAHDLAWLLIGWAQEAAKDAADHQRRAKA